MKLIFLRDDKHQRFLQNDNIVLGFCFIKFAISLQYLKKEVSDEVDFLQADKQESFLQMDSMIFC